MCLLALVLRPTVDASALLFANREESRTRPASEPQIHVEPSGRKWLGGLDLLAGGTWLGLNDAGLLVAVTNRRRSRPVVGRRSRGLLCRDLLGYGDLEKAASAAIRELETGRYDGCNLVFVQEDSAAVVEAGDELVAHRLGSGLHFLTNGPLNDPRDGRIARAREELEHLAAAGAPLPEWLAAGQRLCGEGATLDQPAMCFTGADRGTVSSTAVALTREPGQAAYYFAPGPPALFPYTDLSDLARTLLGPAGRVHRIQLRGPWEYSWLERESGGPGEVSGRVKMPEQWEMEFGGATGRLRLVRRFHRPTNLGADERVFLVIEGVGGPAEIRLGSEVLGYLEQGRGRLEITNKLRGDNELSVEVLLRPSGAGVEAESWRGVTLEIVQP